LKSYIDQNQIRGTIITEYENGAAVKYAIGLKDEDINGMWKWYNPRGLDEGETADFQHWAPNAPDGGVGVNCASMSVGGTGDYLL
jgi:hypothetical protein